MKSKNIISLILFVAFIGCKKKDSTPPPASNNQPTPVPTSVYYGLLTTGMYSTQVNGYLLAGKSARAYFSSQAVSAIYPLSSVKVSEVSLNGDSLTFNSPPGYYTSYSSQINPASDTWSVTGMNGIPSFTCQNTVPFPGFSIGNLPDTISKSAGLNVIISNLGNFTRAELLVSDGLASSAVMYTVQLTAGNSTVNITPANLSKLNTSSNAVIAVTTENGQTQNFGGKDFRISREAQLDKRIVIIQ
jgi:hypothetical protein